MSAARDPDQAASDQTSCDHASCADVPGLIVRDARAADVAALTSLYNHAVAQTAAVWRDHPVATDERRVWLAQRQTAGWPVLAAEGAGAVVGFAALGPFHAFEGYRATAETSVFVAPARHRAGVGRALMAALVDRARAARLHALIAAVEAGNEPSLRLHARLGFCEVGRLPQVGQKFGRWLDLVYMQRLLDDRPAP